MTVTCWRFTIPINLPSQNTMHGNTGSVWQKVKYRNHRHDCYLAITAAMRQHKVPEAEGKRHVSITRVLGERQRFFDVGNLWGGGKGLIDALVRSGVIKDDSPRWAKLEMDQDDTRRSEGPAVDVEIREETE